MSNSLCSGFSELKTALTHRLHHGNNQRFLVAYSGGLDSTVLLHVLFQINQTVVQPKPILALHINHQLSPNADQWQQHCLAYCQQLGVPCHVERVNVIADGHGLEAAARTARYAVFETSLQTKDCLVMGHHMDDQAETVLLRLMRGAGIQGLSAMPDERSLGLGCLWRPFLSLSRTELMAYAQHHQLTWIDDESNQSLDYDRNYLRHQVIPLLTQRWPQAQQQLVQSAQHLRSSHSVLQALSQRDFLSLDRKIERWGQSVAYTNLASLHTVRRYNVFCKWCLQQCFTPPERLQWQQIEQQFFSTAKPNSSALVQWGDSELRYYQQRVYLAKRLPAIDVSSVYTWGKPQGTIAVFGGQLSFSDSNYLNDGRSLMVKAAILTEPLTIKVRQGGERCTPSYRQKSQTVKRLLQEVVLEPWLRDRVPLLYSGDKIVAVGDLWVCKGFEAKGDARVLAWRLEY